MVDTERTRYTVNNLMLKAVTFFSKEAFLIPIEAQSMVFIEVSIKTIETSMKTIEQNKPCFFVLLLMFPFLYDFIRKSLPAF